jgi:hypothetical protein
VARVTDPQNTSAPASTEAGSVYGPRLALATQACTKCGGPKAFDPGRDPLWKDTLYGAINRFSYIRTKNQRREFEHARKGLTPSVSCTMCGLREELPPLGAAPAVRHSATGSAQESAAQPAPTAPFSCAACGAVVPASGNVVSAICESCGNTLINSGAVNTGVRGSGVDGLLPLAIDPVTARRRLMQRCNVLNVPARKRHYYREAEMRLTYYPYVVFSPAPAGTPTTGSPGAPAPVTWAQIAAQAGPVSGAVDPELSAPVLAARRAEDAKPTKGKHLVPPLYGAAYAVEFQPEYLAGAWSVGPDSSCDTYTAAGQSALSSVLVEAAKESDADPTRLEGVEYRVILAPAYTGTATIEDKQYKFWVDGTTGIAGAEVPGSIWAIPYMLAAVPLILAGTFGAVILALVLALVTGWAISEPFD